MEELLEKDDGPDNILQKLKKTFYMLFFSIPVMISNIGGVSVWVVNAYYAGHMSNVADLAAIGIANSWISFVGVGPLISCNYGFFALASQVNGTGDRQDMRIICQRALVFNLILFVISTIILLFSPYILHFLGVEEHIIKILTPYAYFYIFCLFTEIFVDMLRSILNAQTNFTLYPICSVIGTFIHIIQCGIFVSMDFGIIALAFSKLLTNIYVITFIVGYMKYHKINGYLVEKFEPKAFTRLVEYAKNVIPSGIITYVEWMAFEITTIMASNFGDVVLSAHTVFLNILALNYCFFTGAGILYSSLLGNALGSKDTKQAKTLKDLFNTLMATMVLIYFLYNLSFFEWFVQLMTDKAEVREALSHIIFMTYTLCCFDFYQGTVANTLRGVGQQNFAAILYVISYYALGIPLGILLGVVFNMTIVGWFGAMHISQAVFCYFGHQKFLALDIDKAIGDVDNAIASQFSQRSLHFIPPPSLSPRNGSLKSNNINDFIQNASKHKISVELKDVPEKS